MVLGWVAITMMIFGFGALVGVIGLLELPTSGFGIAFNSTNATNFCSDQVGGEGGSE